MVNKLGKVTDFIVVTKLFDKHQEMFLGACGMADFLGINLRQAYLLKGNAKNSEDGYECKKLQVHIQVLDRSILKAVFDDMLKNKNRKLNKV